MSKNKECLFYIDHNPPECSGTWGGAIYKGACKINSTSCNDTDKCFIKLLYQQVEQKEQEYEELRQYHNKYCEEFEKEKKEWLEKYNQISRGFYNGDYCNTENCSLLKAKEQECEELKEKVKKYGEINEQETKDYAELKAENDELIRRIIKIFACLIKANRTNKVVDTLWVDNITTLWDYIAQTLGIEGDQVQIEEQILQKISECEVTND